MGPFLAVLAVAGFWDISLGNVATWVFVIGGILVVRYIDLRVIAIQVKNLDDWRKEHEREATSREKILNNTTVLIEKLTVMADSNSRRLERLERWEDSKRNIG